VGTERRSTAECRTAGPYSVFGRHFVVRSTVDAVVDAFVDGCGDLRADREPGDVTAYRVDRTTPRWDQFGYSLWRDDDLVGREVLGTLLPTLIPSHFARHVAAAEVGSFTVDGVALARGDGAVLLVADTVDPSVTPNEQQLDMHALAVHAMRRHDWALIALDVVALDGSAGGPTALPYHRPLAARSGTRLASLIGTAGLHRLVPASSVGPLAGPTTIRAFVVVSEDPGVSAAVEPASPSTVLKALAAQLSGPSTPWRAAFLSMAEWVETIPCWVLSLGDHLDAAATQLEECM
jgi:hypothetical protein